MTHRQTSDRYGFRFRGGENTRIEAFTDAAFAFAVTLLMIGGGHVPANVTELMGALRGVPGYAASFALLCLFWHAHYTWYRRYGIEDGRSILLSLLLVFLVLIYVYPLHMMFNAAIFSGSDAGAAGFQVRSWADWQVMYIVFGVAYASMCVVILLFYLHALQSHDKLQLDPVERLITQSGALRWTTGATIGLLSAGLALVLGSRTPGWTYSAPGAVYWLIAVCNIGLRGRMRRRMAVLRAPT